MQKKSMKESYSVLAQVVLPMQANPAGGMSLDPRSLPFHLCSLMLFGVLYVTFGREGRAKQYVIDFLAVMGTLGSFFALLIPTNGTDFRTIFAYQCFVYHAGIMWFCLYLILSKRAELGGKTLLRNLGILLGLSFLMIYINGALSAYGSDIPLAVAGVVTKVNMIMVSFAVGLAHGCQPILSFNMGAKNYGRVKATFKKAAVVGLAFSLCAFVLFQCFPRQIVSIFGAGDPLYFDFAESYLRIYMFMVCLFGIQPLSVNFFTSIGAVKQGIFLSVSRQGFLLLPLLIILPLFLGLDGVLYAGPIADFLAVVLSVTMITRCFQRLDRLAAEKEASLE